MITKQSWLFVSDGTNIRWAQIFHIYGGFIRKSSGSGDFVKGSARVVEPPRLEYKGFRLKFNRKGDICRGLIIRTRFINRYLGDRGVSFQQNNMVLIKRKQEIKSKYLYGPISRSVRRKRFRNLFRVVV